VRPPFAYHARRVVRFSRIPSWFACLLTGCAATHGSNPPPAPALQPSLTHYAGSPHAGAAEEADELPVDPASAYVVRARLFALAHRADELHSDAGSDPRGGAGEGPFAPLSAHTRLAAAFHGHEPIQPAADLGLAARVASGEPARAWVAELEAAPDFERRPVAELSGALAEGVTVSIALATAEAPPRARVALEIARGAAGLEVFVVREELAERRESAALDLAPVLDGAPLVLELAPPPGDPKSPPLVWVVELASRASDARQHALVHDAMRTEAAASARSASARRARVAREEAHGREIQDAFTALRGMRQARSALVFLSGATGASLAGDLALVVEDAELERFVAEVLESVPDAQAAARAGATLGFVLETRAWAFLTRGMDEEALAPGRLGLLVAHGGELARSVGAVEDVLAGAHDLAGLEARILEENREALEDASAAVRVRARDWLAARSLAPEGYDPFGTLAERRKALAAAAAAAEAAAPAGSPK